MNLQKIDKPFHFIIFGASGDLAKVKLFPALYELALQKRFPKSYTIYGYARSRMTHAAFREAFTQSIRKKYGSKTNQEVLREILAHVFYFEGQYDQVHDFERLAQVLKKNHPSTPQTLAYFSVPPYVFNPIIKNLAAVQKIMGHSAKIILEKPLGEDEKSATELFHFISQFFEQEDLYLLDHYLGKTPVQSILPLRSSNTVLNLLLKGASIANIQINALEIVGVEERLGYFENVGIIKDMIQSHLLQILALITMAIPVQKDPKAIKREKMHVLSALRYGSKECSIVLGQYKSYRKNKDIPKNSPTSTFAALRCFIDLAEWYKVPIYLRTGKRLNHKHTYIVVEFEKPLLHRENKNLNANKLIIELAPEEKIQINLVNTKGKLVSPNQDMISTHPLACSGDDCLPEHGRLILDVFKGDHTYFVSFEEVIASWRFVDRVMRRIEKDHLKPVLYADGSTGPREQHLLTDCDGFSWYDADHL